MNSTDNSSRPYSQKEIAAFEALLRLARDGKNFSSVKVQDIATAAGIGKGTLYEYFSSKEDILTGTIIYALEKVLDNLETALQSCDSFRGALEHFFEDVVKGNKLTFASLLALMSTLPISYKERVQQEEQYTSKQLYARMRAAERRLLDCGRASGEIAADVEDVFCEYVIVSALLGQLTAYLSEYRDCSAGAMTMYPVDMICRALRG